MTDYVRMIAIGGTVGVLVAGTLAAPSLITAVADEPKKAVAGTLKELFPDPFDVKKLRKYAIIFDESVSTEVQSRRVVTKIGHGRKSLVSIATTATGTYSTDGLASPHVRYPGIEVESKRRNGGFWFSTWSSSYGSGSWTSYSNGSIIFYTYSYKPAKRT